MKKRAGRVGYRHGDVILERGAVLPATAKALPHQVLAEGEVTGHKHQITEGAATLYDHEGTLYLRVESETAMLSHEEHASIALPKGDYRIRIQREYTPAGWENVRD